MLTCRVYDISPDGSGRLAQLADPPPSAGYRWISGSPDDPDIAAWCAGNLDPLAAGALLAPETRPRALVAGTGALILMRGVNLNPEQEVDDMVSLRCWIAPGLIITLRHRTVFALRDLTARIEAGDAPQSPQLFLDILAENLIARIETVSVELEDKVDSLEEAVFDEDVATSADYARLAALRRRAIRLRRYVGPMSLALQELGRLLPGDPGETSRIRGRIHETANRATRSLEELDAARDRLMALADHIDMQQAARQQKNGYLLSLVAATFLPLGFITGLFGVNVAGMPGTDNELAFWVLTAGALLLALIFVVVLYWKRWF